MMSSMVLMLAALAVGMEGVLAADGDDVHVFSSKFQELSLMLPTSWDRAAEFRSQMDALKMSLEIKLNELSEREKMLAVSEIDKQKLNERKRELEKRCENLELKEKNQENDIVKQEKVISELLLDVAAKDERINRLLADMQKMKLEHNDNVVEIQARIAEQVAVIHTHEDENGRLRKEIDVSKKTIEALKQARREDQATIEQQRKDLEMSQRRNEELSAELTKRMQEKDTKIEVLESKIAAQKVKMQEHEDEMQRLLQQRREDKRMIEEHNSRVEALRAEVATLKQEKSTLLQGEEEMKRVRKEVEENANVKIKSLEQAKREVEAKVGKLQTELALKDRRIGEMQVKMSTEAKEKDAKISEEMSVISEKTTVAHQYQEEIQRQKTEIEKQSKLIVMMESAKAENEALIGRLRLEVGEKTRRIDELKVQMQEKDRTISWQDKALTDSKQRVQELEVEIQRRVEELDKFKAKIAILEQEQETLRSKLIEKEDRVEELRSELMALNLKSGKKIEEEEKTISARAAQVEELERVIAGLRDEIEVAKASVRAANEEVSQLRSDMKDKERHIEKLRGELMKKEMMIEEDKSKISSLQSEIQRLKEEVGRTAKELTEAKQSIAAHVGRQQKDMALIGDLQSKVATSQRCAKEMKAEKEALENQLGRVVQEKDAMSAKVARSEEELLKKQQDIGTFKEANVMLAHTQHDEITLIEQLRKEVGERDRFIERVYKSMSSIHEGMSSQFAPVMAECRTFLDKAADDNQRWLTAINKTKETVESVQQVHLSTSKTTVATTKEARRSTGVRDVTHATPPANQHRGMKTQQSWKDSSWWSTIANGAVGSAVGAGAMAAAFGTRPKTVPVPVGGGMSLAKKLGLTTAGIAVGAGLTAAAMQDQGKNRMVAQEDRVPDADDGKRDAKAGSWATTVLPWILLGAVVLAGIAIAIAQRMKAKSRADSATMPATSAVRVPRAPAAPAVVVAGERPSAVAF
ncbi:Uncharacterized protein PBTT_05849 [Plasmodiophora brassicae]|uniref:Uncharacterized protein n=1 Tax=Plasmodiophora brassicae TaxID=37360 RepID=A0A0G4J421_PLABS|nr:hypothetical protein PBRA_002296 [Plasmodiophora brassicae]SPQ98883.1 unnamed protein product [Plasmodiophora brassicae]